MVLREPKRADMPENAQIDLYQRYQILHPEMVQHYDDFTHDLLFQHVQFRRVEKFMRSYLDTGFVISQ
jgi:hypothetical protein